MNIPSTNRVYMIVYFIDENLFRAKTYHRLPGL